MRFKKNSWQFQSNGSSSSRDNELAKGSKAAASYKVMSGM
jgi:hypothetical protein